MRNLSWPAAIMWNRTRETAGVSGRSGDFGGMRDA